MKAAIYARVSTVDQKCEMQLRELREYCTRRGWEIAGEYVDTGWSGTKASRPQLDRLMKHAGEHQFDCVVVWKLDRFGRSVLNLVESLNKLASAGVRFIATTQSIDTDESNPTSKLLLYILAAVAEFEREMIRERVVAGLASAKHRGQHLGRRKLLFDRERVLNLHRGGKSIREIAARTCMSTAAPYTDSCWAQKGASGSEPPKSARSSRKLPEMTGFRTVTKTRFGGDSVSY
jgi:putative DNA-invertase from lambdoid prophage Rac